MKCPKCKSRKIWTGERCRDDETYSRGDTMYFCVKCDKFFTPKKGDKND